MRNMKLLMVFYVLGTAYLTILDEIEIRKCYMDVDHKFKGHHGVILSLAQWKKLVKSINFIDRKLAVVEKNQKKTPDPDEACS